MTKIEIEIDPVHKLMFDSVMEDVEDSPDLEEWAENTIQNVLYMSYQSQGEEIEEAE